MMNLSSGTSILFLRGRGRSNGTAGAKAASVRL